MSDLLALQPNLDIKLYLVSPDDRREKVEQEILRPTFSLREKPLYEVCGFISFSKLIEKADGIRKLGIAAAVRPSAFEHHREAVKCLSRDFQYPLPTVGMSTYNRLEDPSTSMRSQLDMYALLRPRHLLHLNLALAG